jgi:putative pyruvate formate lyase activating enzyme
MSRISTHNTQAIEAGSAEHRASDPLAAAASCALCPRRCGVNRLNGETGFCQAGAVPRLFRYGPHFGEEPPISGTRGSGTLFFSHCTLRCIYCQNHPWSQGGQGEDIEVSGLTARMRQLVEQGCHNWNLVSPTPWLPWIREAARPLIQAGIRLPFVYNTSGFELPETLSAHADLLDIALVDLRYARRETAREASACDTYVEAARTCVQWLWEHLGPLDVDAAGMARRGVICRLLVLPGRADEAVDSLNWLAAHVGVGVHISVMSQYTPVHQALGKPGWDRTVTAAEYRRVTDAFETLGFENGWVQEYGAEAPQDLLGCDMPAGAGAVGR